MTEEEIQKRTKADYRAIINQMGKKEFTLLKMQEYGFWPENLPTPYDRQENETEEEFAKRKELMAKYKAVIDQIAGFYKDKDEINKKIRQLRKKYDETWDIEKIRMDIAQQIMRESIARRKKKKAEKEIEKQKKSEAWQKKKSEEIVFVGKNYSSFLYHTETDEEKLKTLNLPVVKTAPELANLLEIEYKDIRFLAYHRDVISVDHYTRYQIPKRSGGLRNIAAPKPTLKKAQRMILDKILSVIPTSNHAHGFLKGKSIITSANVHPKKPTLVINMDIEDFFPTITFERVRGMIHKFGYSGFISTLIALLCTYCERIPIEVKDKIKYVALTHRILPQGSPASPMITNIICRRTDKRLSGLAEKFGFKYTRYADDMSFTLENETDVKIGRFCGLINKILKEEGFEIKKTKTRFLRKNNQQSITGIVINNDELAIPRKWIRKFRAAIYNANKLKESGKLTVEIQRELSGMASWVKSVNATRYNKYITAVSDLLGAKAVKETPSSETGKKLEGLSFCFTGKLETMKRADAEQLVIEHGGEPKKSVVKGLSYLVTNFTEQTVKFKKAQEQGTKIITENEFLEMIK